MEMIRGYIRSMETNRKRIPLIRSTCGAQERCPAIDVALPDPVVSGKQAVRAWKRLEFLVDRVERSHDVLSHSGRSHT